MATIAIFNALNVDPVLNMLVFGESILNDAVSIVLTKWVHFQMCYGCMETAATLVSFNWVLRYMGIIPSVFGTNNVLLV